MKKAYRNGSFVMNQSTFDTGIDGMEDKNGQPIGRTNYGVNGEETYRFMGKNVETVEDDVLPSWDDANEGDVIAVFMNFSDYVINTNMEMQVVKWTDHDNNSCAGIDGAIRKVGMLISLVFMLAIDVLIKINLIGFIPEQARTYLGLDTVGVAEFFALLYIAYEVVSIFKNMALCGLPVKKVWEKVREFLAKYTDELPDTDELDGDSTTGNVEEHRTQER